jgi:ligand-binding sensor domain-containing protein/DNA-binding response OmpR family regulator
MFCPPLLKGQNPSFSHVTTENGLSSNAILTMSQDAAGFMWMGTANGINRYDGRIVKQYLVHSNNQEARSSNNIFCLHTDQDGVLWAGTYGGLLRYSIEKDAFVKMSIPGYKGGEVTFIYSDQKKNLWVGSARGLYLLSADRDSSKIQSFFHDDASPSITNNYIKCIYEDHTGAIWVGTNGGLTQLQHRGSNWQFQQFKHIPTDPNSLSANYITTIMEDAQQGLWFGTLNNGLNKYNYSTGKFIRLLHSSNDPNSIINNNIRQIALDQNGRLWVGTQEGLSIIQPLNMSVLSLQHEPSNKNGLNQNSIYSIYQDAQKSMWVGTYFGGANISFSSNTLFQIIQNNGTRSNLSNNVVSGMVEDSNSDLWIGTEGGGLNRISKTTGTLTVFKNNINQSNSISSNLVKSVYKDLDGQIWAGTAHGGGVNLFDPVSQTFKRMLYEENYESNESSAHTEIQSIYEDQQRRFWLGTTHGLKVYHRNGKELIALDKSILTGEGRDKMLTDYIVAKTFCEDDFGRLWIGMNYGLFLVERNHVREIYSKDAVNSIVKDKNGKLWFGLDNGGIAYYDVKLGIYAHYSRSSDWGKKKVFGILPDKKGNLWLSTEKGLVRLNPENGHSQTFTVTDGIAANEFNYNAYFKNKIGVFYFGGYNGITNFLPEQIEANNTIAKMVFTGLKIFNTAVLMNDETGVLKENIAVSKEMNFKYHQNVFTIEFALLNFIKSNKNRYQYQLEGYDKEWIETENNFITYSNLPYGKYLLTIKGANNDGVWGTPIRIKINMHPPFWLTWWAYCFYACSFLLILLLVYRFYFFRALLEKEEELHQVKMNFFTNVSHEILTHLTLIMSPIDKISESNQLDNQNKEKLKLVKSNTNQLLRLVRELMDFRKAETNHLNLEIGAYNLVEFLHHIQNNFEEAALAKNILLKFHYSTTNITAYFDPQQLEKVFFNLLNNAIKFTQEGGSVTLAISETDKKIQVQVSDNGRGIHPEYLDKLFTNFFQVADHGIQNTGYGIGLALSKNIIELHHGEISVKSIPAIKNQEGHTSFTVTMLKGNKHFEQKELVPIYDTNQIDPINNIPTPVKSDALILPLTQNKFSLLIAEDNPDLSQILAETFEDQYQTVLCKNGLEAWEKAIIEIPDLILSDVMMPLMDGFELCEKLKTDARTSHIPVILLTAKTTQDDQIAGLENGADSYLTKPFSTKVLELHIRNLLTLRENMRQKFSLQISSMPTVNEQTEDQHQFMSTVDREFYDKVVQLIHEHLENPEFGVTMLSRKVAMSAPILYKKLKAVSDLSVNDFIKLIRMKKAAELLMKKELTIAEIAYQVGYNDRKYFSKEFKKQYGVTPTEFMQQS